MGRLLMLGLLLYAAGCDCPQPQISSINPASGPAGTIVEVTFTGGGLGGVVIFDGTSMETRSASSIGIGKKLRFTVPYNATTGSKNVQVTSSSQTSPAVAFNVTGPGAIPTPAVGGFSVGGRDGKELTVFGTGFTTLSKALVDGVEVSQYFGNSLPLRELPFDFVDQVIITTPAAPLVLGSAHAVQVRNPGNINSNVLNFDVPGASRVCQVEFDALQGITLPDYYVLRGGHRQHHAPVLQRLRLVAGALLRQHRGDRSPGRKSVFQCRPLQLLAGERESPCERELHPGCLRYNR